MNMMREHGYKEMNGSGIIHERSQKHFATIVIATCNLKAACMALSDKHSHGYADIPAGHCG